MRLTRYSDYSLRVLMYLALQTDRLATITEVAEHYGISRNHVMKVVYDLGTLGYIESIRGRHGGLRLACPPEEIQVGQLIRETESEMVMAECFQQDNECVLTPSCVLKTAFRTALTAFIETLDEYTLADLVKPRTKLLKLLEKA